MEEGGSKHLFDILDGIGYPSKTSDSYYHIFSNQLLDELRWVDNFNYPAVEIVTAQFPGYMGDIAARAEHRVNKGFLGGNYVYSTPVILADQQINRQRSLTCTFQNLLTQRQLHITLDFSEVVKDIEMLKKYGDIPIKFPLLKRKLATNHR